MENSKNNPRSPLPLFYQIFVSLSKEDQISFLKKACKSSDICCISSYDEGIPEDFVVTYMYRKRRLYPFEDIPYNDQLVTEKIGYLFSLKRCSILLHRLLQSEYPNSFQVERCYHIISLILRASSETWIPRDENTIKIITNDFLPDGTFIETRSSILEDIFSAPKIEIYCTNKLLIDGEELDKKIFNILELLSDDNKYQIFLDFWGNLPNYEVQETVE
jgi:hypothetical protein